MADDNLTLYLRIELLEALKNLEQGGRAGRDFDDVITQLVTDIYALEKQAAESGSVVQQVLGEKLKTNIDTTRQSIELLKTGFRELVASGRSLEDIGAAFTKIKDRGIIEGSFGEKFAAEIKAGVGTALKELEREYAQINKEIAKSAELTVPLIARSQEWRNAVNKVKDDLRALIAAGKSLDDAIGGLRERNKITDTFAPGQITQGAKEIRQELSQIEKALQAAAREAGRFREEGKRGFGDPQTAAQLFRINVEAIKTQMLELQRVSGLSLKDIEQGFRAANQVSKEFTSGQITKASQELRTLSTTAKDVASSMSFLDQVSTVFFGTTLGTLALNAIRRLVGEFDELIKRGIAVSRSFFIMATATRGWQRLGVDITIAEVNEQVGKLSEVFSFFTQRQLREGVGQILLLTRNLQLSKEEIFELTEATATLAIVTGKDFGEEGMLVARAIASGYTEALQRAGIEASRTTIQTEALKHGIDKAFLAMTQAERATVTLGLVLNQVGNVQEDVAQFQETVAGKYAESTADIQEQADIIGTMLTPAYVGFLSIVADGLTGLVSLFRVWQISFFSIFVAPTLAGVGAIVQVFRNLREGVRPSLEGILEDFKKFYNDSIRSFTEDFVLGTENIFSDVGADQFGMFSPDLGELETEEIEDEFDSLKNKLGDILFDFANGIADAWTDFQRKLEDIDIEELRKLADLEEENQEKIAEIGREYQDKLAEAQRKFREKEIQAEIDFQEKMRQLREKFLFDLEDALRERDAKQVLRLIREFNLRSEQMGREEQIAADERERAFQLELQQLAEQRDIKLRELAIENELKRKEIAEDAAENREDAQRRYEQELADNKLRFERRMEQLRAQLSAEEQMWLNHAMALIDIANFTYQAFNAIWSQLGGFGSPKIPMPKGGGMNTPIPPLVKLTGFAEGGTMFANKPTRVMFGEAGPEMATFTPLGRLGRNQNKIFGNVPGSFGGGRVRIEVLMQDGLIGKIIDTTLGEMSDIIVRNT